MLLDFAAMLLEEGRKTNLTGARSIDRLITAHILDSLAPLQQISLRGPVLDLGSGAGLPGIPVALAEPKLEVSLLEPRAKRAAFLRDVVERLLVENVDVVQSSAAGPKASRFQGTARSVLMRAVAAPQKSIELGLPFLRGGGILMLYEGRASRPGLEDIRTAKALGGAIDLKEVRVPFLAAQRHVWIVRKKGGAPRLGG